MVFTAPKSAAAAPAPASLTDYTSSFINERQLADRWGVSIKTIQALRLKGGGVRFAKLGGRCVRYRLVDVETYEAARMRENTSQSAPNV